MNLERGDHGFSWVCFRWDTFPDSFLEPPLWPTLSAGEESVWVGLNVMEDTFSLHVFLYFVLTCSIIVKVVHVVGKRAVVFGRAGYAFSSCVPRFTG